MKSVHLLLPLAALAVILTAARADERETATVKFSDPAKPGTLKVALANGDVRIRGADTAEIAVRTDLKPETPAQRKDGLRVLTSSSSYSLVEKNNVVTLSYGTGGWPGSGGEFDVTVPRATHIVISSGLGGDIVVDDVTGDLEIKSLNGEISLHNVAGGALVETMNGEINVDVRALVENKPLSFTSMNGEIRLNVPVDARADVNFRTHNGSILTDFDSKQLVTKTASLRAEKFGTHALNSADAAEIRHAVRDAVRVGMEAAREATRAARDAVREAQRSANANNNNNDSDEPKEPADVADNDVEDSSAAAPVPPVPPLPPMTGGKIVSGTLNGGGTKIMVATMNGDVTLRKLEPKK